MQSAMKTFNHFDKEIKRLESVNPDNIREELKKYFSKKDAKRIDKVSISKAMRVKKTLLEQLKIKRNFAIKYAFKVGMNE